MKKTVVIIGVVAVTGILYACGGSSSKNSGGGTGITTTVAAPPISTTVTPISNQAEAARTVNASKTLASSFASGSSFPSLSALVGKPTADQTANGHRIIDTVRDMQQRITGIVEKQKSLGKQVAAAQSAACTGGGVMSVDVAIDPIVVSFSACKDYDVNDGYTYKNGTISLPKGMYEGTSTSGTLAANLTTISYAYGGYTTKNHESVLNMTLAIGSFNSTNANFTINGSESNADYVSKSSDKQSFGNFLLNMSTSTSGSGTTTNITMDGTVSMDTFNKDATFTTIDTASGMAFKDFQLSNTENTASSTSSLTVNGTYAIKTIPACMDGTFLISTGPPIVMSTSTGVTISGKMTANGVAMVFNADGSVTATLNGSPIEITSYADVCSLSF